jgi:hypothetical protein
MRLFNVPETINFLEKSHVEHSGQGVGDSTTRIFGK